MAPTIFWKECLWLSRTAVALGLERRLGLDIATAAER
jgi:hypothetical protein